MTFSLLARDTETGAIGGAAATGSLCVGGWVLRGRPGAGMSASQGTAPSTIWGERVLDQMARGVEAAEAVVRTVAADPGREHRQLAALDPSGQTGAFTGAQAIAVAGSRARVDMVAAGNMLSAEGVPDALLEGYAAAEGAFSTRLLAGLRSGAAAGGDRRGLQSAALLVFAPGRPPLTLRIDHAEDPLAALEALHARATSGSYAAWTRCVPVIDDEARWRAPDA